MFLFMALLLSLLAITNVNAYLSYKQAQRRLENLQKEYDALEKEIRIKESELDLLRELIPGINNGENR
ncbi:hypothetical protein V511_14185 [Mesotoga sp. Brook.08.YT.4.2.5.1]|uniref:hypothetical protein n=2 Tax=Mesotoga TaxID=1184396 RepID=UPI000C9B4BF3|nr:hypothetical protein [Mesotoga sp. Brook.08.YT.4.2.5.1]PXF35066.1 hypothetical protein EU77_03725 [Mesotoga sp. SC_NapDC]RAM61079.1 hypothetical protein DS66_00555 [Mesotoga sp. SC_3PWM13N19]RAO98079.1 hypothetical protein M388_07025 [Mesotoga sp. Brook.08.YT.4.2.5.4.]RDI94025.1 hypothetical protein Q502_03820 [Mesotoga sp. Brook.08.YT.4.2.5.2.]PNE18004.1 hypothetical protein V511_14185 [Mesotoga sp. Brook.08.YT.4.2.5.1]